MIRSVIQRPIAVTMLFLGLLLIGILSLFRIPVDLLPSIVYPRLTVVTTYADIPPEDLERLVTQPIEEVVTALSGVRRVLARTREGISSITVEYEWGTNMDFANLHLREAVDRVAFRQDFPEEAERPVILRWDPSSRPISILVLQGEGHEIEALTEFTREVVKPALEQVDGLSQAEVVGGADREILVEPDPEKLAIYNVTMEDIRAALARSNISFPGGKIRQGPLHLSLRINGEYETLEDIRGTDVTRAGGAPVRIGDIARVVDTTKELEGMTLLGDEPVVSLLVYKEPEANTIKATEQMDRALEVLRTDYGAFEYSFIYRDADYVRASFSGLTQSLIMGSWLSLLFLFFFLGNFRSPIVVGLSIPISMIITFAVLYFGKVKINLMSLGGLSLASGMLVDNSIVVMENVTRHFQNRGGDKAEGAARRAIAAVASAAGTGEMVRPVVGATLTTVAVFFPVVYVPGIAGAFFRDQALSVTFSMLVSIVVALLLIPMLSARILAAGNTELTGILRIFRPISAFFTLLFAWFERAFLAMRDAYHRGVISLLRRPGRAIAPLLIALVVAGFIAPRVPRSFMPERTQGDLRLDLDLPAGTPLKETIAVTGELAAWIAEDPAVQSVFSQVGRTESTLASLEDYTAPNTARIRIILQRTREAQVESRRIQQAVTERLQGVSDIQAVFREEGIGLSEILSSGEAPFTLGVVSDEPLLAVETAEQLRRALLDVPGIVDLQVDRVLGTPNVVLRLKRDEILRSGLDPAVIARELRNRTAGVAATTFNEVEQRIDIAVRVGEDARKDLTATLTSPVAVAGGHTVPLRSFVEFAEEIPVRELVRRDQRRMVTLTGDVRGRSLDDVWKDAMAAARKLDLPPDVMLVQAGEGQAMMKSFRDLGWAMLLAVGLVYMILAAQFESFLDPLLVAAVIPLGLAGCVITIALTGNTINILSMIGAVALIGICVNDTIVKMETIRRLREEGVPGERAVHEAGMLRFRPIMMTAGTTIVGVLPMAIGLGSGEQLQRPLAITIMGGLMVTTLLTLFYVPVFYKLAHRLGDDTEEHRVEARTA